MFDETNPIAIAVAPLKEEAENQSEAMMRKHIAFYVEELEKNGWDIDKVAPYPKSFNISRAEYMSQKSRRDFVERITGEPPLREGEYYRSRRPRDPHPVVLNETKVEEVVKDARLRAAQQYIAYVQKLLMKIGPVKSAELERGYTGSLWNYSVLNVITEAGVAESWKTQMIINVSVLGKVFNQWPTRKMKK
jgi:hypothetical protein